MIRIAVVIACLAVAGCTSGNTEKDFLCNAQEGQPCRTMADVDGRVTRTASSGVQTSKPTQVASSSTQTVAGAGARRLPERTGRMWVAPYHNGQYIHEGGTVRFVVRNSRWAN